MGDSSFDKCVGMVHGVTLEQVCMKLKKERSKLQFSS